MAIFRMTQDNHFPLGFLSLLVMDQNLWVFTDECASCLPYSSVLMFFFSTIVDKTVLSEPSASDTSADVCIESRSLGSRSQPWTAYVARTDYCQVTKISEVYVDELQLLFNKFATLQPGLDGCIGWNTHNTVFR